MFTTVSDNEVFGFVPSYSSVEAINEFMQGSPLKEVYYSAFGVTLMNADRGVIYFGLLSETMGSSLTLSKMN